MEVESKVHISGEEIKQEFVIFSKENDYYDYSMNIPNCGIIKCLRTNKND